MYIPEPKYRSKKVVINGEVYDSKKEYSRYRDLQLYEKGGMITDLQRQVTFELIPMQRGKGKTERSVKYIADFTYTENGEMVVEDVKGFKTKDYIIKRKLMLSVFGIVIKEV